MFNFLLVTYANSYTEIIIKVKEFYVWLQSNQIFKNKDRLLNWIEKYNITMAQVFQFDTDLCNRVRAIYILHSSYLNLVVIAVT